MPCGRGRQDRFDGGPESVGDLVLGLALAGAASRLAGQDLEYAGECDSLQPGEFGRNCARLADRGGDGRGLTIEHFGREPVNGRADRG